MLTKYLLMLCLLAGQAHAQLAQTGAGRGTPGGGAPPPTFVGPIDLVGAPTFCLSLRACSGTIAAAGTQKIVNVKRVTDSVACDVLVATSGDIGLTSATCNSSTQGGLTPVAFAGTDATCTGAITTTTLTCSVTLHVGDQITCGTCAPATTVLSGASPTWTIFPSQTVVSQTITATVGLTVPTWYDQSSNATNATFATPPVFLANCPVTHYCIFSNGSTHPGLITIVSGNSPFSFSFVGGRYGNFATTDTVGSASINMGFLAANQAWGFVSAGNATATASDSALHSIQYVLNGASTLIYVDGTATSGSTGTGASGTSIVLFTAGNSVSFPFFGYAEEMVGYVNSVAFTGTTNGNVLQTGQLCNNQFSYWGTAASC